MHPRRDVLAVALLAAALASAALVGLRPATARAAGSSSPIPTWAYYYIWYNASSWNRAKSDYPLLGRYSSDEPSVMRAQIRLARQAGIDGFIVSWKSTPTLDRRLALLARVAAQERFHLAIIYQGLNFNRRPLPIAKVSMDLATFARQFAPQPVFHAFGKPLVIWSGTWMFSPRDLAAVTSRYRDRLRILASERNARDYLVKAAAFDGDAYYWSSVNPSTYPDYDGKLDALGAAVHGTGGMWIAPAAPGFDGRLVGHPTIVPRSGGATLRTELGAALRSSPDAIGLISWNEFSENSQVEPSHRYGTTALRTLADLNGTHLTATGPLDSSEPAAGASGENAIPALLTFLGLGVVAIYLLGRRKRGHAVR